MIRRDGRCLQHGETLWSVDQAPGICPVCDTPPPDVLDAVREHVRDLYNGTGYTREELDEVHYFDHQTFTLRESLAEEAEWLESRFDLKHRETERVVEFCATCLQPGCWRCDQDDIDHAGLYDHTRPAPGWNPGSAA